MSFSFRYHGSSKIKLKSLPLYIFDSITIFQLSCFYLLTDSANLFQKVIELTGDIKKLSLTVEPQVIDLKTCVANSGVYAASFKVFNTSKGPYSIFVKIPRSMKNHAHINPKGTIIQSYSHCDFSLRLYPRYEFIYIYKCFSGSFKICLINYCLHYFIKKFILKMISVFYLKKKKTADAFQIINLKNFNS